MCTFINTFKSNYAFNVLSVSSSIYVYPLSFLLSKQFLYSLLNSIHAANTLMFVSIKFVVRSRFISFLEMYLNNIYNAYEDIRSSKLPSYIYTEIFMPFYHNENEIKTIPLTCVFSGFWRATFFVLLHFSVLWMSIIFFLWSFWSKIGKSARNQFWAWFTLISWWKRCLLIKSLLHQKQH